MAIKRYVAEKDTTITNAYRYNRTRAKNANMGASDILEVYSIYGQSVSGTIEKSRVLVQFPVNNIISDRNQKLIAGSGSCQFILRLSNAPHGDSTMENVVLSVSPLSRSWSEGVGLDMEEYLDVGFANWMSASKTDGWSVEGGDVLSSSYDGALENVTDDLEIDITSLVEQWIGGTVSNNGVLVALSSSLEDGTESYYTKKFFARRSQYFYKRPIIEARFDSSIKDNRRKFYASSNLMGQADNTNTLFLYNSVRGEYKNIPSIGTGSMLVSLYSGGVYDGPSGLPLALNNNTVLSVTGGLYSTGIYTASMTVSGGNFRYIYDVWSDLSGNQLHTGSAIEILRFEAESQVEQPEYILSMPLLKQSYSTKENAKLRVTVKNRQWDSNIYSVASYEPDTTIIENLFYKIERLTDGYEVFDYGTGSFKHTLCSYDDVGNYFNLDMGLMEPGYSYRIKYGYTYNGDFYELKDAFKFRVD